jgi:hypothetical protein
MHKERRDDKKLNYKYEDVKFDEYLSDDDKKHKNHKRSKRSCGCKKNHKKHFVDEEGKYKHSHVHDHLEKIDSNVGGDMDTDSKRIKHDKYNHSHFHTDNYNYPHSHSHSHPTQLQNNSILLSIDENVKYENKKEFVHFDSGMSQNENIKMNENGSKMTFSNSGMYQIHIDFEMIPFKDSDLYIVLVTDKNLEKNKKFNNKKFKLEKDQYKRLLFNTMLFLDEDEKLQIMLYSKDSEYLILSKSKCIITKE